MLNRTHTQDTYHQLNPNNPVTPAVHLHINGDIYLSIHDYYIIHNASNIYPTGINSFHF